MKAKKTFDCSNCGKKDCEKCVKDGGKTFCCQFCCNDAKKAKVEDKKEPMNVCKFC
ncbi:MAG TPA: hypothetical protein VJB92_00020 [Candidatus Paceibacterota bacterium]